MGARPTKDGVSGVHTHMTNSLNTPAEALEYAYPIRFGNILFAPHSGGAGLHNGGDGIVREIEVLTDAQVTLLADRRSRGPYGLAGGADGARRAHRDHSARWNLGENPRQDQRTTCVPEKESASNRPAAVAGVSISEPLRSPECAEVRLKKSLPSACTSVLTS
jgi:N-methylhydantoinase B/oxoprolinase/acetone carboxylase alpha subunit